MKLNKTLTLLSLIFFTFLILILLAEIIVPTNVKGTLTCTRISGKPISSLTIYLPLTENKENIFKITNMEALTSTGFKWHVTPGPSGYDKYPDYWVLNGPPLYPGDVLVVEFIMENVRDINYSLYPWTIVSDVETKAPINIQKNFLIKLITFIETFKYPLILALSFLTLVAGTTSLLVGKGLKLTSRITYNKIDELKEKEEEIKRKASNIEEKIKTAKLKLGKLEKSEEKINDKINEILSKVSEEKKKIKELTTEKQVIKLIISGKTIKLTDKIKKYAKEDLDKLNKEYKERMRLIDKKYKEAKKFVRTSSDRLRIETLFKKEYEELEKWHINQLELILKKAEEELRKNVGELKTSIEEHEEYVKKLKKELSKVREDKSKIKREIEIKEKELKKLKDNLKTIKREINELQEVLNERKNNIITLIDDAEKKINREVSKARRRLRNVKILEERIAEYKELVNKLGNMYNEIKEILPKELRRKIESTLSKSREEILNLERKRENLEKITEELSKSLGKVITESKALSKEEISKVKNINELMKIEEDIRSRFKELSNELKVLKEKAAKVGNDAFLLTLLIQMLHI